MIEVGTESDTTSVNLREKLLASLLQAYIQLIISSTVILHFLVFPFFEHRKSSIQRTGYTGIRGLKMPMSYRDNNCRTYLLLV
jgi:hypothetical protein